MSEENKNLSQIIGYRIDKLNKLREMGFDPFPYRFDPNHKSTEILNNFKKLEKKDVCIAGRIMALRKMGKASFMQLMDDKGQIQIFIKRDSVGEKIYECFKLMDIGDFVGINGFVFKTKTGEISVHAEKFTVLSKSIRPLPIVKEKEGEVYDAFKDKELKYRNRHLDLIVNSDTRDVFRKRTQIISEIRMTLDSKQFLEVETPVLQPIYGGANARPFTTHHNALEQKLYLRIADELYLKRLIIGGFEKVYEMSKDFRNEGMDRNHNPEFTMLEFYWAYADYRDCMMLVEKIIRNAAKKIGELKIKWGEFDIDLSKKFENKTFYGLLEEAIGSDISMMNEDELFEICNDNNIKIQKDSNIGQLLDALMGNLVEPKLINPTFVIDYPKSISPLAKTKRDGSKDIVERFELFIGGSEFANSFTELNDPIDQRERLEQQAELRDRGDEEAQPVDEEFIRAMEAGMPPTGGVGIGIDRLVMLLTNNRWIRDVILFPTMRIEKD
ncbi:MAG: lysine--tRNA ligase [bacterium TMED217]|nr:MAG: lysine--tRNA ligase [bacterium TMED217]|tara:strand:+ start:18100 stop:19593 length:1494 start_codon:yes stop_codon:yes gene_type:complete